MRNDIKTILICLLTVFCCSKVAKSQTEPSLDKCTTIGQTPATAFPVCATSIFEQKSVPNCSTGPILVPGCSNPTGNGPRYRDESPFWYKFTCFESGTLGFLIKAKNQEDDYDWQLWDITGKDPNVVFSNDASIIVAGNWAGTYGNTGASSGGAPYINCASFPDDREPSFARMPNIIEGHEYLLMVSHYSGSEQSGYELSFNGGTAVITDPNEPSLLSIDYSCDGTTLYIKTNKKILNGSIAVDGSDFTIDDPSINVTSAKSALSGFDSDSIILKLDQALVPGEYNIIMKQGTDGNTLADNCGNYIAEGENLSLKILPPQPTLMDSLAPPQCAPDELELVFRRGIVYETVTSGGQKFLVDGPATVNVTGTRAETNSDGITRNIFVTLDRPLVHGGKYRIILQKDEDGDTFFDECGQETPEDFIEFEIKDTVNADFMVDIDRNCDRAILQLNHDGRHDVNSWDWQLDFNGKTNVQNPSTIFTPAVGDKIITLAVSNEFCTDTIQKVISFGPKLTADFETNNIICPEDSAVFINKSEGNITDYMWDFGDGAFSNAETPDPKPFIPPIQGSGKIYPITLTVRSDIGCTESVQKQLRVLVTCFVTVPNAFTPNSDGLNDYLYPLNAYKTENLTFRVYNRYGQKIFESKNWLDKWDGTFKGEPQDSGEYAWTLEYTDITNGERVKDKGRTLLVR